MDCAERKLVLFFVRKKNKDNVTEIPIDLNKTKIKLSR